MPCGWVSSGNLPLSGLNTAGYVCESGCGNGVVEPGEACEGSSATCTNTCRQKAACTEAGGVVSPVSGHCYFTLPTPLDYTSAHAACPAGTHLATLEGPAETAAALAASPSDAWFALRAATAIASFAWDAPTGDVFDPSRYHDFSGVEPNDNTAPTCVRMRPGIGWDDKICTNLFLPLCERE